MLKCIDLRDKNAIAKLKMGENFQKFVQEQIDEQLRIQKEEYDFEKEIFKDKKKLLQLE